MKFLMMQSQSGISECCKSGETANSVFPVFGG